jgi:hypothetical protein
MPSVTVQEITKFIEEHIPDFHRRRLESLTTLKLKKVLRRKNPYLFKAKFVTNAPDLVKMLLDAHLSSQEETVFGGFLEGLAVFICERVFVGKKSSAERNEEFQIEYGKVINRFTAEFIKDFCQTDGIILWEKLVQFNSAVKRNIHI